ncbi:MAG: murein biosynthesis integral membrane protein MurJ [Clostridiaceae bacterium]|nr:murein biosynthesis integral membrane protein MurJ [Clostridiaceae bacterium]
MSRRNVSGKQLNRRSSEPVMSVAQSTFIVALALALSKITGFVREIIIAPTLGYGINTDAYFIGFQIPDLVYQLMIGGAIGAALTPFMSSGLEKGQERRVWRSVSIFMNVFLLATAFAVVLGIIFAPGLITSYNADKDPLVISRAVEVSRALFPQILFLMAAGFLSGILQAYRLFQRSAFGPTIYNIACIVFIILWGNNTADGPTRAAAGIVLAAIINLVFMLLMTRDKLRLYRPTIELKDQGFRRLWSLALPTLISGSVIQINYIIQTSFANQFTGAVTALQHGTTTWTAPYGIFAVAVSNVMTPTLSRAYARRDFQSMRSIFTKSLRRATYFVAPFAIAFAVMAEETIEAIYQWNKAIPYDRLLVEAGVLRIYCLAMLVQTIVLLYNNAFYSRQTTRISLLTSVLSLVFTPLLSMLFTKVLNLGIYGLPLAYAVNSVGLMLILHILYRYQMPLARPFRLSPYYFRLIAIAIPTALVFLGMNTLPINITSKFMQLAFYAVKLIIGLLVYYLAGIAIDLHEAKDLQRIIHGFLRLQPGN